MADKQLHELAQLTALAADDVVLAADASDNNAPKRLRLDKVKSFVNDTSCIDATGSNLLLKSNLNANNKRLTNLANGTSAKDAVTYGQLQEQLVGNLPALPAPSFTQTSMHLWLSAEKAEIGSATYLFYYALDTSGSTTLSVSGMEVVATGGATVHEVASANNAATVIRSAGMMGKYLHLAVRYRNLSSVSPLSPTFTQQISEEGVPDIIGTSGEFGAPSLFSVDVVQNRLVINGEPGVGTPKGTVYVAEVVFSDESLDVTGYEPGIVRLYSRTPNFTYDLPLMMAKSEWVNVRIVAIGRDEYQAFSGTESALYNYDMQWINEDVLFMLAERMSERLMTMGGDHLQVKNPKK